MVELGIVDIRELIRVIQKVHKYDFSNFALTSFKYSLEKVIAKNGLLTAENLFRKISEDPAFFDTFLHDFFVPSTEMFRDPSLWRWLREEYFPNLPERHYDNFKIWIPQCVSGAELYTLCILLKELKLLEKVKIFASVYSKKNIEFIQSGKYPVKKLEVSIENYKRFKGSAQLDDYYSMVDNEVCRDASLIKSVEFIEDDIYFSKAPQNVKLILFRNVMIYYNPTFQKKVLEKMNKTLSASGNLIIGTMEDISSSNATGAAFEIVNKNESVYKRKL
jgi:chemotaxis protein methyltransferase CheR